MKEVDMETVMQETYVVAVEKSVSPFHDVPVIIVNQVIEDDNGVRVIRHDRTANMVNNNAVCEIIHPLK